MTFTVRPWETSDDAEFDALQRRVYGAARPKTLWDWKFANAQGRPVRWVAVAKGQIIGHYAVFPVPIRIRGDASFLISAGDALTDPAFRNRGVYTELSLVSRAAWGGVAAFQFSCLRDLPPLPEQRIGWRRLGRIVWLSRPVAPTASFWRVRSRAVSRVVHAVDRLTTAPWRAQIGPVDAHPPDADALNELAAAHAHRWPVQVVRDAAWWRWRLAEPGKTGVVRLARRHGEPVAAVGAVALRDRFGSRAVIVDGGFSPDHTDAVSALIPGVLGALPPVRKAAALAVPGSAWHTALHQAGFRETGHGFYFGVMPFLGVPTAPLYTWAVTGGESDAV